jgi:hypothetical protein
MEEGQKKGLFTHCHLNAIENAFSILRPIHLVAMGPAQQFYDIESTL